MAAPVSQPGAKPRSRSVGQVGRPGYDVDSLLAVAVGVPSKEALQILRPFASRLRALQAELAAPSPPADPAGLDGCEGKDCRTCDERVVCDKVREVLAAARREPRRAR